VAHEFEGLSPGDDDGSGEPEPTVETVNGGSQPSSDQNEDDERARRRQAALDEMRREEESRWRFRR
jgi:hypothetical protein